MRGSSTVPGGKPSLFAIGTRIAFLRGTHSSGSRQVVASTLAGIAIVVSTLTGAAVLFASCGDGGGGGDGEVVVETSVFGRVLSAVDETPLQGVTISAADVDGMVRTDEMGRFMLPLPAAERYAVTASLDGYTYAQRWAEADDLELVSVQDMFLPHGLSPNPLP